MNEEEKILIARNGRALPGQTPGAYPQGKLINKGLPGVGEGLKEATRFKHENCLQKGLSRETLQPLRPSAGKGMVSC